MKPDEKCGKPNLLPGDIVRSKESGNLFVIVKSKTIINGCSIEWSDDLPEKIEHGWMPTYAADKLPGQPTPKWPIMDKHAWWEQSELELIERGPLHKHL
jgi:hypothetical protein